MDARRAWTQTQKGQQLPELTEDEARTHLETLLWPSGPVCAHCGGTNVYRMRGLTVRAGLHRCRGCKKTFTVTVGTIFEDTHLPLAKWIKAFHLMCSSKKGISALQLQRNLGLGSYRTAWFMCHRIRLAMKEEPMAGMLKGNVEVDEAYVGGKPRKGTGPHKRGRGTNKAPVLVLVERGGKAHSRHIEKVDGLNLKSVIREMVDKSATICTDELGVYNGIGKDFTGGHQIVNHGKGEFVNGIGSTNTAESYFSLLKRGVMGTFHQISRRHLHRYCDEFSFRWNIREKPDIERREIALGQSRGKRLVYRKLIPPAESLIADIPTK